MEERGTEPRFEIMDYDSIEGETPYCVVDFKQTGSDGEALIIGRYSSWLEAELVLDACRRLTMED